MTLSSPTHQISTELLAMLDFQETYTVKCRASVESSWTDWGAECKIGFGEKTYPLNLEIFPQPIASGQPIQMRMKGSRENVEIIVMDLTGKINRTANLNFSHMEPNTMAGTTLQSGLYLVQAIHEGQSVTKKLVVE